MVLLLCNSSCVWSSTKQRTVATSSTEAEYISQCYAAKQMIWARRWLQELGFRDGRAIELKGDNQGCLANIRNPENHLRTKHIDVQYHFTREAVEDGLINVSYIPSDEMAADIMTKPLTKELFLKGVKMLGMREV